MAPEDGTSLSHLLASGPTSILWLTVSFRVTPISCFSNHIFHFILYGQLSFCLPVLRILWLHSGPTWIVHDSLPISRSLISIISTKSLLLCKVTFTASRDYGQPEYLWDPTIHGFLRLCCWFWFVFSIV